ncbi:MAG: IS1595 family transposase [Calditrichaeota bacterium]|nr:MAG: IS1595 family transposase [Calditrichota bacterium]
MNNEITFFKFQRKFSTELRCLKYLFKQRWPNGFICPKCQHNRYSFHTSRKLFQCKNCEYQASITAGTIFHKTRTPLKKWFWMIFFISKNKTGYSILYLQNLLEIPCYKTAWVMVQKIREAMQSREVLYKLNGEIELDDAYFGPRNVSGKRGRGADKKTPAFIAVGLREVKKKEQSKSEIRPGFLKIKTAQNVQQETAKNFVLQNIEPKSLLKTDGYKSYKFTTNFDYNHQAIRIGNPKETLKYLPWVHIVIGNAKGLIKGVHHGVSAKYLDRFFIEFCYKFNRRFIEKRIFNNLINACCSTKTVTLAELRS